MIKTAEFLNSSTCNIYLHIFSLTFLFLVEIVSLLHKCDKEIFEGWNEYKVSLFMVKL